MEKTEVTEAKGCESIDIHDIRNNTNHLKFHSYMFSGTKLDVEHLGVGCFIEKVYINCSRCRGMGRNFPGLRASTHYAIFGRNLVFLYFHVFVSCGV
jgi:hypothetical protein